MFGKGKLYLSSFPMHEKVEPTFLIFHVTNFYYNTQLHFDLHRNNFLEQLDFKFILQGFSCWLASSIFPHQAVSFFGALSTAT